MGEVVNLLDAERDAFLRTIRADPDDDTGYGVFADWLDEHDEHDEAFRQRQLMYVTRIRRCPDDDTPRLVYADWLQERDGEVVCGRCGGDRVVIAPPSGHNRLAAKCPDCDGTGRVSNGYADRAEFIRVQCELALWGNQDKRPRAYGHWAVDCRNRKDYRGTEDGCTVPPDMGGTTQSCEYHQLRRREQELLSKDRPPLLGVRTRTRNGVTEHNPYGWIGEAGYAMDWCHFRRGFVEAVECTWATWERHYEALLAHPDVVLREVTLTTPVDYQVAIDHGDTLDLVIAGKFVKAISSDGGDDAALMRALPIRFPGHCPNHPLTFDLSAAASPSEGEHVPEGEYVPHVPDADWMGNW